MGFRDLSGLTDEEQKNFSRFGKSRFVDWYQKGDEVCDKIYSGLYLYATYLLNQYTGLDDMQKDEVLATLPPKIVKCMQTVQEGCLITPMLPTVVRNSVFGFARNKKKMRMLVRIDDSGGEHVWDKLIAENSYLMDASAEDNSDLCKKVREAIDELSPEHKQVIDLFYFQRLNDEQISSTVGANVSTVRTRKYWARKYLAKMLSRKDIVVH